MTARQPTQPGWTAAAAAAFQATSASWFTASWIGEDWQAFCIYMSLCAVAVTTALVLFISQAVKVVEA